MVGFHQFVLDFSNDGVHFGLLSGHHLLILARLLLKGFNLLLKRLEQARRCVERRLAERHGGALLQFALKAGLLLQGVRLRRAQGEDCGLDRFFDGLERRLARVELDLRG